MVAVVAVATLTMTTTAMTMTMTTTLTRIYFLEVRDGPIRTVDLITCPFWYSTPTQHTPITSPINCHGWTISMTIIICTYPAGTRTSLQGVRWRAAYLKPCSRRIQYLTECLKLQFQIFQRPVEDVSKTLIIWKHHKDIKTFWRRSTERSWRHFVNDFKSYDLKLK